MRRPPGTDGPVETAGLPAGVLDLAHRLPDPEVLRRHCQGLAALDAVAAEDPVDRYYSFDAAWGPAEQRASMDDGSGNSWSITFTAAGAWLRGFDHESPMSPYAEPFDLDWLAAVPPPLHPAATEPAATEEDLPLVTLACWWLHPGEGAGEPRWHPVRFRRSVPADLDDGGRWLLAELDTDPDAYVRFAAEYHETDLDRADVAHVLALRPLDEDLVRRLNPARTAAQLAGDLARIGYPGT